MNKSDQLGSADTSGLFQPCWTTSLFASCNWPLICIICIVGQYSLCWLLDLDALDCFLRVLNSLVLFCGSSNVLHVDACNCTPLFADFFSIHGFIATLCVWHLHVCWVHATVLFVIIDLLVHVPSFVDGNRSILRPKKHSCCPRWHLISTDFCGVQTKNPRTLVYILKIRDLRQDYKSPASMKSELRSMDPRRPIWTSDDLSTEKMWSVGDYSSDGFRIQGIQGWFFWTSDLMILICDDFSAGFPDKSKLSREDIQKFNSDIHWYVREKGGFPMAMSDWGQKWRLVRKRVYRQNWDATPFMNNSLVFLVWLLPV